ncbi:AAA family ATPase [Stieleria varia]|uniref:ATPase RavA n=1 Tax=Stieleria varia TaxID=2528005 RepID=A0A5C6A4W4_9BACT|nr:MoxR family ATPase [Stieleria varia]TWT94417.1 ATPase RavA [Stieleria varia]
MSVDTGAAVASRIEEFGRKVQTIRDALHEVIVGQEDTIDQLLICALTGSHALLVGVPGLAKTLVVKALAAAFDWDFSRIQFTPDLMPSDVTGYELMGAAKSNGHGEPSMVFRRGPLFGNLILADEINRATPKTQSALLEAMAERHVTVAGMTHEMHDPFLVVATQNPIEQEGTYPLPEAQLDRFMMQIHVGYPTSEQEKDIVRRTAGRTPELPKSTLSREGFLELRELVMAAPVPENVVDYAVTLCRSSRPDQDSADEFVKQYVAFGAGPRGSQCLAMASKARALLAGRAVPTVADVNAVAIPILRHRILGNHRAIGDQVDTDAIVKHLLSKAAS